MTNQLLATVFWSFLALAPALLIAFTLCAYAWKCGRIKCRIARIRARGEPTTFEEVAAAYDSKCSPEATKLWLEALDKISAIARWEKIRKVPVIGDEAPCKNPPPGYPWSEMPLAEEFLQAHAPELDLLHAAARTGGHARRPTDMQPGETIWIQLHEETMQAARCLSLEARVHAHQGRFTEAADSILAGLALAQSMEFDPTTLSQLERMAYDGVAFGALKALLPTTDFTDADLARLQEVFLRYDFHDGIFNAFLGERVRGIETFRQPASMKMGRLWTFAARIMRPFDEYVYLEFMDELVSQSGRGWPDAYLNAVLAERKLDSTLKRCHLITRKLVGMDLVTLDLTVRTTASARIRGIALALERYRRSRGQIARTLDDLTPDFLKAIPTDPYNGNPFQYQASAEGYVVYSLGKAFPVFPDPETGADYTLIFRYPPKPWTKEEDISPDPEEIAPAA